MNLIFNIIKKIVISGFTLFTFNLMIRPFNFTIPINIVTLFFTSIFGLLSIPFLSVIILYFL